MRFELNHRKLHKGVKKCQGTGLNGSRHSGHFVTKSLSRCSGHPSLWYKQLFYLMGCELDVMYNFPRVQVCELFTLHFVFNSDVTSSL